MAWDVFICHKSDDRNKANEVCNALESAGLRCWIAPRDVPSASDYPHEIVKGIENSDVLLLLLTDNVNTSVEYLAAEVNRAVSREKIVFAYRMTDITIDRNLNFLLSQATEIDARSDTTSYARLAGQIKDALAQARWGGQSEQPVEAPSGDYDIFLSYRREGGEAMAKLLHEKLSSRGYRVFLDIDSLKAGRFDEALLFVIESCTDFVLVLSKGSLKRCARKNDWVRREVAHAIANGKNVIPIFLRGFKWPMKLPKEINQLKKQHYVSAAEAEYIDAAVERLYNKFLISRPQQ